MKHIFEYLINRKLTAKDANKNRTQIPNNTNNIPNNEIWYEADEKLDEVTHCLKPGLHIISFDSKMIEHTFNNGKGVITFKDDITDIGEDAFFGCNKLTKIIIPNSIATIENYSFHSCEALTAIIYNGPIYQWDKIYIGNFWYDKVPEECIIKCTDGELNINEV